MQTGYFTTYFTNYFNIGVLIGGGGPDPDRKPKLTKDELEDLRSAQHLVQHLWTNGLITDKQMAYMRRRMRR